MALLAYSENMAKYPEHHAPHTDPAASLLENGRLLWMMDRPDGLWAPPGQPQGSVKQFMDQFTEDPDAP